MSARPRPVTATVTKPPWMRVPNADAAVYRRQSLTSNGSTASLTSVLDHDSYISEPDLEEDKGNIRCDKRPHSAGGDAKSKLGVHFNQHPKPYRKVNRQTGGESVVESNYNLRHSASSDSGLSAWEMWLVQKAKEERRLHKQHVQVRKQEKQERVAKEQEKQVKELKAAETRQVWLHKKNHQEKLSKKMERLKVDHDKRAKQETEERVRSKAAAVFNEWRDSKLQEDKKERREKKEKERKELEEKKARQEAADAKYQEWLKRSRKRPQSAPAAAHQQKAGYNNNAPYPQPGYINPRPWVPPTVPKVKSERPKKSRPRRYVWNPDKYF